MSKAGTIGRDKPLEAFGKEKSGTPEIVVFMTHFPYPSPEKDDHSSHRNGAEDEDITPVYRMVRLVKH